MGSLSGLRLRHRSHPSRGFTLIEAMVVVAILAILASLAAPSFASLVQRMRIDSARNALSTTIQAARTEAIRNGRQVNIDPQACAFADWACGWVTYVDLNTDGTQNANEPTIRQIDAFACLRMTTNIANNAVRISRFGQAVGLGNGAFLIGPRDNQASNECRSLVLNIALNQTSATGAALCPAPAAPAGC